MTVLRAALSALVIVAVSACQVTPKAGVESATTEPAVDPRQSRDLGVRTLLATAAAYLDAADPASARQVLDQIARQRLDPMTRVDFDQLRTALALRENDVASARAILDATTALNARQRTDELYLRAQLARLEGRPGDAAAVLFAIDSGADAGAVQALNDLIWSDLSRVPVYEVSGRAVAATDSVAAGWWALASLASTSFDLGSLRQGLVAWQREHRDHPAAKALPQRLVELTQQRFSPTTVALLVPLSGPLAGAGSAVRDGFLAAFYRGTSDRRVLIYDSALDAFAALYEQAIADGADAIVGPLDKPSVSAANAMATRVLPTLALNYLGGEEVPSPNFFQIGLAIEDEAAAIAERIIADGVERIALFATASDWSTRAANEIRARLSDANAQLVSDAYIIDTRTITSTVGQALLVEESAARRVELENALGSKVEFVARRRHDLDAIIALTDAVSTSALQPALAFHFAADVPLYGTSQLTQGGTRALARDLDGVRVTQMPWRVYPDALKSEIEQAIPSATSDLGGLYALGVDAYRIIDRVGVFASEAVPDMLGATGVLSLDRRSAFRRSPVWAVISDGALVPLPIVVPAT